MKPTTVFFGTWIVNTGPYVSSGSWKEACGVSREILIPVVVGGCKKRRDWKQR